MKVGKSLRTTLIVTVITVIVWVVADRSVLRSSNPMTVDVVVRCDAGYRVTVIEPADKTMTVTFTGPGRGIDRLAATDQRVKWEYLLSAREAARAAEDQTTYAIPARDGFARWATDESRVTLADSDTPQVTVRVEKLGRQEVSVALPPDDQKQLAGKFEIEPRKVTAVGTAADLRRLNEVAFAKINLKSDVLLSGKPDVQTVKLLPGNRELKDRVTFEPTSVTVRRLQLSQALVEKTIEGPIVVRIDAPPQIINTYRVMLDPAEISNLKVMAPVGVPLKAGDVHAVVKLDATFKPVGETGVLRLAEITFPGHTRVTLVGSAPGITITVKPYAPPPSE